MSSLSLLTFRGRALDQIDSTEGVNGGGEGESEGSNSTKNAIFKRVRQLVNLASGDQALEAPSQEAIKGALFSSGNVCARGTSPPLTCPPHP